MVRILSSPRQNRSQFKAQGTKKELKEPAMMRQILHESSPYRQHRSKSKSGQAAKQHNTLAMALATLHNHYLHILNPSYSIPSPEPRPFLQHNSKRTRGRHDFDIGEFGQYLIPQQLLHRIDLLRLHLLEVYCGRDI